MKILVLAPHPFFQNRGTPIALRMLLETLCADGHSVTALVYHEGEDVNIPNCRILRTRKLRLINDIAPGFSFKKLICDFLLFTAARKLLKTEKFDIIHAGEEAVFLAYYFNRRYQLPYVYDMDSSLPQQVCEKMVFVSPLLPVLSWFEGLAIKNSRGVLPVCKYLEELALSYDSNKTVQRLEDVSLLSMEISESKKQKTDLSIEPGTTTLMYVGNLERYQGINLLLEGFALASKRSEAIRLIIIGGSETDLTKYSKRTQELDISDKVRFTGPKPVEDLACYLLQADILVSPRVKGFNTPMKIYSYLDSGRVVLATRLQTHTQVLDDSIACLVDPETTAMSNAIVRLTRDKNFRTTLAKAAQTRIARDYTTQAFKQKLQHFYSKIEEKIGVNT